MSYKFNIQHKSGAKNTVVAALSHVRFDVPLVTLSIRFLLDFEELGTQVDPGPFLNNIKQIEETARSFYLSSL